ncbi:LOW QUALITY PROTEIN: tetratricopeptide repeat protein 28-like [Anolis carolinensis]|uniref:LOW QUALITY PROTEIN: tetratricopeptide repeat protein 28-like n=1 Tax=Anolis carolinensis TaxID=28377 RepID=UPI002F2B5053
MEAASLRKVLARKARAGSEACVRGDFRRAASLFGEALEADPDNCALLSNRSAAHLRMRDYAGALADAQRACAINPKWAKAYFRQGVALQYLGRHGDALAAFASGLAQDPKSLQLLLGITEAALKSPLRESLEPTYAQLQRMGLDKSAFVVVSVIGQELLTSGQAGASVVVLEAALQVGTASLRLRGSVLSALAAAHWALGQSERSQHYMLQDLHTAKALGDQMGECRAYGNLGSASFSKGNYREALTNHRQQLMLAMKLKDRESASSALTSLGHVYTSIGDFPNALSSHKQCVLLARQGPPSPAGRLTEARELGNMGAVYIAMGDFQEAVRCHEEHLRLAKELADPKEEARAYSNLGSAYHFRRQFDRAMSFHNRVLELATQSGDKAMEMRAFAGLGHAARGLHHLDRALDFHQKQAQAAEELHDRAAQGRATSNLGILHQLQGDFQGALRLHQAHLAIAQELSDYAAQGRAFGNMGNAYSALGRFEEALRFHRQELQISLEVADRPSQAATHGNMAVAYQALGAFDRALQHYRHHLTIAREMRDAHSESRALANLGNFYCSRNEFSEAVPYYESYLRLAPDLQDLEGEGKICHNLAYAHYALGNYADAVKYYEMDLGLAKDLDDSLSQAKAYCNLGLAYKALRNDNKAEECQKHFLSLSLGNATAKFRALGNLGDIAMDRKDYHSAIKLYEEQLDVAIQDGRRCLEAAAYAALGSAYRALKEYDKAMGYFTRELEAYQEASDAAGECRAEAHLASVYVALGKYNMAFKCYEAQLELARGLQDPEAESRAYGNMGIARMNAGAHEEAVGFFERQLAALQQSAGAQATLDRGRAHGHLGDCYMALGDFEEAARNYEKHLSAGQALQRNDEQEKAYRGLGAAHRSLGSLSQSLVCLEKRLVCAFEGGSGGGPGSRAEAFGDLGRAHGLLGNLEAASSCLERAAGLWRERGDRAAAGEASRALGALARRRGDARGALALCGAGLAAAEEAGDAGAAGRAYAELGLAHEALGDLPRALQAHEQRLSLAAQTGDLPAKADAYAALGRAHHALRNHAQAVMYLQEGLRLAEQLCLREDEARIRHGLGLSLWASGNLEEAQHQLYGACGLFEGIRRGSSGLSSDFRDSLFGLQASSYRALQRVLVARGLTAEALGVAERGRTRAFADLLLERQGAGPQEEGAGPAAEGAGPPEAAATEGVLEAVSGQRGLVLYFSLAGGTLYSWLIAPGEGILKFNACFLEEEGEELPEGRAPSSSTLEQLIAGARKELGVDARPSFAQRSVDTESESEMGSRPSTPMATSDPNDFLQMVSRNNLLNRNGQSLSSLCSSSSSNSSSPVCPSKEGAGTSSLPRRNPSGPKVPPLRALYDLLIAPMEGGLMPSCGQFQRHLTLVLEGDLFLVPFALLKGSASNEFLYERFTLIAVPSIHALTNNNKKATPPPCSPSSALVVANPSLPPSVRSQWLWGPMPAAESEALTVAETLGCPALTGAAATKERVTAAMPAAECLHFATHVSWKLSAVVLAPEGGEGAEGEVPTHDFLLTAADVLALRLRAKLVVLGCWPESPAGQLTADGLVALSRAFLAAGAQCVLVQLWPVPAEASAAFAAGFYGALAGGGVARGGGGGGGVAVSAALVEGIKAVQRRQTKGSDHPAQWAGFTLIGRDVKLSSPSSLIGQALREILQHPDRARDALRVLLHLVEKSLQRIQGGQQNAMYTSQSSVAKKVGGVPGWQALLSAVGFRLNPGGPSPTSTSCSEGGKRKEAASSLPAAVFFPTKDPGDRLQQCSSTLQALLGLPVSALQALCKLTSASEAGEQLISQAVRNMVGMLHQVLVHFQVGEKDPEAISSSCTSTSSSTSSFQVAISVQLWRLPGCHEFLAALGFDLCEVGQEEVILKTGKQAGRRPLTFALQALMALFDWAEVPKRLSLDSSSSLESLASSSAPPPLPLAPPLCPSGHLGPSSDALSLYSLSSVASSARRAKDEDEDEDEEEEEEEEDHYGGFSIVSSEAVTFSPGPNSPFQAVKKALETGGSAERRLSEGSAFRRPASTLTPERGVQALLNLSPRHGADRLTAALPSIRPNGRNSRFLPPSGRLFPSPKC